MMIKQGLPASIRVPIAARTTGAGALEFSRPTLPAMGGDAPFQGWRGPSADRAMDRGPDWARAAVDALGTIGLPAAALSRSHRLAAANRLMEPFIPQVVQDRPSRLGLAGQRADAMLGQALLQVQTGGPPCAIPVAATGHLPPSIVHVLAMPDAADAAGLLVLTALARPPIASARILQDLFDLTPAEARVARGIAAGKTIRDIAGEAGFALGTVRQQLKSVFGKTGVARQADLVGLLAGSTLGRISQVSAGAAPAEE
jgi:DNA-binding CsgD family transcriptional regulator